MHDTLHKPWKPHALRAPVLILTLLICWGLMALLHVLLTISQRDGGIFFAPKINDLPLSKKFLYQYLPTIIAVVFSIFWSWIDLETKRLEPFYELSKEGGALGRDSLLLHYPYDFVPLVPITAAKRRHWAVFCASTAVVLITWGLVPTQAGIFTISSVTRSFPTQFTVSDAFLPAERQKSELSLTFATSVYGIVTLNETLPPYMSRTFTLAPFDITPGVEAKPDTLWTAATTLYSLDMQCDGVIRYKSELGRPLLNSTQGCRWDLGLDGNSTIGVDSRGQKTKETEYLRTKEFSAMYVGYWNDVGFADYYLEGYCPREQNHTFYAGFTRNKKSTEDDPMEPAAIFCQPVYYTQDVNATIDAVAKIPKEIVPLGPKRELQKEVFNTTLFESQLNSGVTMKEIRDGLPMKSFPSYNEHLADTELSQRSHTGGLPVQDMAALAVLVKDRPLEEFLDPMVLAESYAAAYRLMFSRAVREVLVKNSTVSSTSHQVSGQRQETSQAVMLVPVFTYIVEALLGLVSITALALKYFSVTRKANLRSDPCTIASIMALTADEQPLLSDFAGLDSCTTESMRSLVKNKRYKLIDDGSRNVICEIDHGVDDKTALSTPSVRSQQDIAKPIRPKEFRWFFALPFVMLHIALAVTLAVLFFKSQANGLPLPSRNKLVQNMLENYIPTAIATLIEPMWILINRLLCLLQPLEELRSGKARAPTSIDLDYISLPPQLVIFKAIRSKHFVLAAVCFMALLANLLAVALAGLFTQDIRNISTPMTFQPSFNAKFIAINGSSGPRMDVFDDNVEASGAFNGGDGYDQFLIAVSNTTRGTQLPAWIDEKSMYMPFERPTERENLGEKWVLSARTKAFGANLKCEPLSAGINYTASLNVRESVVQLDFNTTLSTPSGGLGSCSAGTVVRPGTITGDFDITYLCQEGPIATEFTLLLNARPNATQQELDSCSGTVMFGWVRNATGSCGPNVNRTLDDSNSLFIRCKPELEIGEAMVLVDSKGQLQQPAEDLDINPHDTEQFFSNDPSNLIMQANRYMFDRATLWHNDTFANHFINYFVRARNGSRLFDPSKPPPIFQEVEEPLTETYRYLFAIWLGANKERLLVPYDKNTAASMSGSVITFEERLLLSTSMCAVAEAILLCYAIVATFVYLRRPGQYLARLPTTIASIIVLFAASTFVQDMRGTSQYGKAERSRQLRDLAYRYGYGSYVGGDGKVHIGIEKVPFVRIRSTGTWFDRKLKSFRKN